MAADLDRTSQGCPVHHLWNADSQQISRTLQSILGRLIEVASRADEADRSISLDLLHAMPASQSPCPPKLGFIEGTGEIWHVFGDRKQDRTINVQALDDMHLQRNSACYIAGVASNLAVTLKGVHTAHVYPATRDLNWTNQYSAFADCVHVEVSVGLVLGEFLQR
jgi:hypothetical protein